MSAPFPFGRVLERRPAASRAQLDAVEAGLSEPLTRGEIAEIIRFERNPFPPPDPQHNLWRPMDPAKWPLPPRRLPAPLRAFFEWSDGGVFNTGKRHFQFLSSRELRPTLLKHHFPKFMPGALPFARNDGPCFYAFDLRGRATLEDPPVVFCSGAKLGFDEAISLGGFLELLRGTSDPEDQLHP